jgi:hypothetical protein
MRINRLKTIQQAAEEVRMGTTLKYGAELETAAILSDILGAMQDISMYLINRPYRFLLRVLI